MDESTVVTKEPERKLRFADDQCLREICLPVAPGEDVTGLVQDLFYIMRKHRGVGLSAPQIGVNKRVSVVEFEGSAFALVNPEIIRHGRDREVKLERCLSLPLQYRGIPVERWRLIEVSSQGRKHGCSGWLARIVQHEMDHLEGILIVDYLQRPVVAKPAGVTRVPSLSFQEAHNVPAETPESTPPVREQGEVDGS